MTKRSLKDISTRPVELKDLRETMAELKRMDDRPAAIVAAALVEDAIQDRILGQMKKLSKEEYGRLFLSNGPLSTFSAKIRVANALKVLSTDWSRQIDVIREIRNAFAHARIHLDFSVPEIIDRTTGITVVESHIKLGFLFEGSNRGLHQLANSVRLHEPRSRYIGSCLYFAFYLWEVPATPDDWDEDDEDGD